LASRVMRASSKVAPPIVTPFVSSLFRIDKPFHAPAV
jgi:hypothetical protein